MTTPESLAHAKQQRESDISMKSHQDTDNNDEIREEYDFSSMKGGVRGKYAGEFEKTAVTVLLDSDVARIFPNSQSVNEALRTLTKVLRNGKDAQQGA